MALDTAVPSMAARSFFIWEARLVRVGLRVGLRIGVGLRVRVRVRVGLRVGLRVGGQGWA